MQQAALAGLVAADAQRVARRKAAGLEDYFGAILGAECARRVGVGIFLQDFAQRDGVGFESGPPVAEGVKDDRSGAEDFLDPGEVFAGYADDHVHQLGGAESLADYRADAEVLGFLFRVFDGNGIGQRHERERHQGFPADFSVRRSRTRSLKALPSTDFPSRRARAALITAPICFSESAPASAMAASTAR
jgi:hypothetical protein